MAHRASRTSFISRFRSSRAKHIDSAQGFTIVELTIVIVVIAILATIVTVSYNGITRTTLEAAMQADLNTASTDLTADRWSRGEYPADTSVLNDGYGLKASGDNVLAYTKYANGYCVSVTNPGTSTVFSIFSGTKKIVKEACEEGAAPGDPEDPGSGPIAGFPGQQMAKLIASDGASGDQFGYAVDVDGDTAIVAAYNDAHGSSYYYSGSAYIFVRSGTTWTQQAKLLVGSKDVIGNLGYSVAIDGDTAVVASRSYGGDTYVFVRSGSTWEQQTKFTPNSSYFTSVDIDGDTIIVGALQSGSGSGVRGSFYIYTRSGTTWTQEFTGGLRSGIGFGSSVAIDGDTALVGSDKAADHAYLAGAVYVYTRSWGIWTQQATLTASDAHGNQRFGGAVALSGGVAAVGAPGVLDDSGSAYVFTGSGSTWVQETKIQPRNPLPSNQFGTSVALTADTVLVGAPGGGAGAAYVFTRVGTAWSQQAELLHADRTNLDAFGFSVALDGSTALIGAHGAAGATSTKTGAAFIFAP